MRRGENGGPDFLFYIISYNARYVKYRGVKKPSFPDFGSFEPPEPGLGFPGLSAMLFSMLLLFLCFCVCIIVIQIRLLYKETPQNGLRFCLQIFSVEFFHRFVFGFIWSAFGSLQ